MASLLEAACATPAIVEPTLTHSRALLLAWLILTRDAGDCEPGTGLPGPPGTPVTINWARLACDTQAIPGCISTTGRTSMLRWGVVAQTLFPGPTQATGH